jgi:hypothetical protein
MSKVLFAEQSVKNAQNKHSVSQVLLLNGQTKHKLKLGLMIAQLTNASGEIK